MRTRPDLSLRIVLAVVVLNIVAALSLGCASNAPPNLAPADLRVWQANEVQLVFGSLQRAAIGLNGINRCDTATPPVCTALLSNTNTAAVRDVTTDVVLTLRATPDGWLAIANRGLTQLAARLSAEGQTKLAAYIGMVRTVVEGL